MGWKRGKIKLWLQVPKKKPIECIQIRGEDVQLRKGPGRCGKQRYALIVEFNVFYYKRLIIGMGREPPLLFQTVQSLAKPMGLESWIHSFKPCF